MVFKYISSSIAQRNLDSSKNMGTVMIFLVSSHDDADSSCNVYTTLI